MAKSEKKSTAIVKVEPRNSVGALDITGKQFAELVTKSGLFRDVKSQTEAIMKIVFGASLGIDPVSSMMNIILVGNKMSFSGSLIAARIRQSGKYRFEVINKTDKLCELQFYELIDDYNDQGQLIKKWIKPGPTEKFTYEMAKRAGLLATNAKVWASYPEAMLFNRVLSAGARVFCSDIFLGAPVYCAGELGEDVTVNAEGEVIADPSLTKVPPEIVQDAEFKEADAETPDTSKAFAVFTELIKETGSDVSKFLTHYKCAKVEEMSASNLSDAIRTLKQIKDAL